MIAPNEFKKGGFYYELYQRVFLLHMKHAGARTDEDWTALADEIVKPVPAYERKLITEIALEIERVYKGGAINAKEE